MTDHDHQPDAECPNCALTEKLLAVLEEEQSHNPILHLNALNTAMQAVITSINVVDEQGIEETAQGNA